MNRLRKRFFFISLGLFVALAAQASTKEIVGVHETITLLPDNIHLKAKFDTGADSSSLDARNMEFFKKDGQEWVRFQVTRSTDKKHHTLEYPIARTIQIVSRTPVENTPGKSHQRRPLINMEVCINNQRETIEVNLIDRSNFKFPFLLGASGLAKFDYVVDVELRYELPATCTAAGDK